MKTLIINGSPRKNGDTAHLIEYIKANISSDYTIINAYEITSPCIDCRVCSSSYNCPINDDFSPILNNLDEYERVIIASPLYYNQPTGALLSLLSRFQLIFAREHFTHTAVTAPKLGGIVLVGGGDTVINPKDAEKTLRIALRSINCRVEAYCESLQTSTIPAYKDTAVHNAVLSMLDKLNIKN